MTEEQLKDFNIILSNDKKARQQAYLRLMQATNEKVDWAYDVWDKLKELLKNGDNHQRSIAAQLLSNLTKSDPNNKMSDDLQLLFKATKDEKFVTARHTLQNLWRVVIGTSEIKDKLIAGLEKRFKECQSEKNCTLIRYDISVVLRKIYNHTKDDFIIETVEKLIDYETDQKYAKKYKSAWKDVEFNE